MTSSCWTYSHQIHKKRNVCCLSHLISGISLWQPSKTISLSEESKVFAVANTHLPVLILLLSQYHIPSIPSILLQPHQLLAFWYSPVSGTPTWSSIHLDSFFKYMPYFLSFFFKSWSNFMIPYFFFLIQFTHFTFSPSLIKIPPQNLYLLTYYINYICILFVFPYY